MAKIIPRRCGARAKVTSLTREIMPCLGPALRREEKGGSRAERRPEQRPGGENRDVLPVKLPVGIRPVRVWSSRAPRRDLKLTLEDA